MIGALQEFIGANDMMAYLVMMTVRLVELRRVLKPTGSLYLHCDPTASHYLKVVTGHDLRPAEFQERDRLEADDRSQRCRAGGARHGTDS